MNVRHAGSLLSDVDLSREQFLAMIDLAAELKRAKASGVEERRLTGRNIALIFQKASTRTRCAFEVAAFDQGAHVTYLGPDGSHLGHDESIADSATVLGGMFDGIEFRGFDQESVEQLADHAGVPVWNGLTDTCHPTQMLADIMTMREHHAGRLDTISYCFLGDGRNNVARSLLITGALLGMDVRIAAPPALFPPDDVIARATRSAAATGARTLVTDDVLAAVQGADFLYTDVWVSMGEPIAAWDARVPMLMPYRVTAELMRATGRPGTRFMHCLPAVHDRRSELGERLYRTYSLDGCEVTDEVFASERSIVFDQSRNRLHTIKAVLVNALGR